MGAPTTADRAHSTAMLVAAFCTVAYWVSWFTRGDVATAGDPVYVGFENAFPLADAYMAACLVVAGILLLRGRPAAVGTGIAAGSAVTYLGLMDTLFNLEHGKYAAPGAAMAVETAINVVCLTFGPATMVRLWQARARLGAAGARQPSRTTASPSATRPGSTTLA